MKSNLRMIVAGGGTGGHFFPAQAICKSLYNKGINIKYMGSKFGIEANFSNINNDIETILLNIRGIQRQLNIDSFVKNSLFPFRFIQSYFKSLKIMDEFNPHVVIGTGGYSSGLPLIAAMHKGIKTVIQEQNSYPGITTRKLGSKVDKVCISFKHAKKYFKKDNIILTGNPIRKDIHLVDKNQAKQSYHLNPNKPVIGILGGSQGSTPFNLHFQKHLEKYTNIDIQLLWQTGGKDFINLEMLNKKKGIHILPFINNMNTFYSAADIIISRSGALALSEMALLGKAMILIPLPHSAGNHQAINAKEFTQMGSSILINQSQLKSNYLEQSIFNLIQNPKKIKLMEIQSKKMCFPNSTEKITEIILEVAKS